MKTTTKILIGTGVFLFLLLIIGPVSLALLSRNEQVSYSIDWGRMARQQLKQAKYLEVWAENVPVMGQLNVLPLPAGETAPYVEFPEDLKPYFVMENHGDTLRLCLRDFSLLWEQHEVRRVEGVIGANLYWAGELPEEINNIGGMSIHFAGMHAGKPIRFKGYAPVVLSDSCHFVALRRMDGARLELVNSRVDTLTLKLTGSTSWQMSDSQIGVLQLSGDEQVYCDITGMEVDKVEWQPESENARLRFNLDSKPASIIYKE